MRRILLIVTALVALPVFAEDDPAYTMEDLTALVENEGWQELLDHAMDIKPRFRKKQWKEMVERAATEVLKAAQAKGAGEAFAAAYGLPDRYPTLKKSPAFMTLRTNAGVDSVKQCFAQSRYGGVQECLKSLDNFLKDDPGNAEAHFKAGKLARLNTTPHAVAAPYFLKALKAQKDAKTKAEWCVDGDLKLAVLSGFSQPSDWPQVKDAKAAAFEHCYKELGDDVWETFLSGGTYEARNLCGAFDGKRKLTAFQKAHCQDLKE